VSTSVVATERLYLTADQSRLVRQGDTAAASLYCGAGTRIGEAEARALGYFDLFPAPKASPAPADKQMPAPRNKGRAKTTKKAGEG
jgi:hypothetical protein